MRSVLVSMHVDPNTVSLRSPVVGDLTDPDREQLIGIDLGDGVRRAGWISARELGRALFSTARSEGGLGD